MTRSLLAGIVLARFLYAADLEIGEPRRIAQGPAIINVRALFGAGSYL